MIIANCSLRFRDNYFSSARVVGQQEVSVFAFDLSLGRFGAYRKTCTGDISTVISWRKQCRARSLERDYNDEGRKSKMDN